MSDLSLREIAYDSPEYHDSVGLRSRILRQPLGLTFTPADLADDEADIHLAAFSTAHAHTTATAATQLVAVLILHPSRPTQSSDTASGESVVKMRQVAVAERSRGAGVGRRLVEWSEQVARLRGYRLMRLHAREPAVGFYVALGYRCVGDEFTEVGIPHQRMEKVLL